MIETLLSLFALSAPVPAAPVAITAPPPAAQHAPANPAPANPTPFATPPPERRRRFFTPSHRHSPPDVWGRSPECRRMVRKSRIRAR